MVLCPAARRHRPRRRAARPTRQRRPPIRYPPIVILGPPKQPRHLRQTPPLRPRRNPLRRSPQAMPWAIVLRSLPPIRLPRQRLCRTSYRPPHLPPRRRRACAPTRRRIATATKPTASKSANTSAADKPSANAATDASAQAAAANVVVDTPVVVPPPVAAPASQEQSAPSADTTVASAASLAHAALSATTNDASADTVTMNVAVVSSETHFAPVAHLSPVQQIAGAVIEALPGAAPGAQTATDPGSNAADTRRYNLRECCGERNHDDGSDRRWSGQDAEPAARAAKSRHGDDHSQPVGQRSRCSDGREPIFDNEPYRQGKRCLVRSATRIRLFRCRCGRHARSARRIERSQQRVGHAGPTGPAAVSKRQPSDVFWWIIEWKRQ